MKFKCEKCGKKHEQGDPFGAKIFIRYICPRCTRIYEKYIKIAMELVEKEIKKHG